MRDDEMQVLGSGRSSKNRKKWYVLGASIVVLIVVALFVWRSMPKEVAPDGKAKIGSTLDDDLRRMATGVLNNKLVELNGLQGQVIIM